MTTTAPNQSSSKGFILAIVVVIIAGIAGVAFLATGRDSAVGGDAIGKTVTVTGDALAPMPESVGVTSADTDTAVGKVAPDLELTDFDGNKVSIKNDGRAKIVYFVAHWCPHCQAEVPLIQELIDEGKKPADIDLYAVSTSVKPEAGNYPPQAWLKSKVKLDATLAADDEANSALITYGGGGFPFAVYLDPENKVLFRTSGELGKDGIESAWQQVAATATASK